MTIYYFQTNICCLVILGIVNLAIRNKRSALPARRLVFSHIILITALICVSDTAAWFVSGKFFPGSRALIEISNLVYFGSITWIGYSWLNYVNLRINSLEYNYARSRKISSIPLILMLAILASNPFTNLLFSINENNEYVRGSGIFIHWIVSWGYLFYATVKVLTQIKKAESKAEKSQLMPMLLFIIPPVIAAALQMVFYGLTSTQCGITVSILIIVLNFLKDEISADTLTGLNNRRAMENYINDKLAKSNGNFSILMCDIDKFKAINDTLGHTAGDLVLQRMSEVLKKVCGSFGKSLFLCRYGGDEFVICSTELKKDDIDALIAEIESKISAMNADYSDDLNFGISIGSAVGNCSSLGDVERLLSYADATMYSVKKSKNAAR